jgi:diguanylate cyclase (GGDEF)-like protein
MSAPHSQTELQAQLAALKATFHAALPERLGNIGAALAASRAAPEPRPQLGLLHRLLHTMAGSAGTFGFIELGNRARALESRVSLLLAAPAIAPDAHAPLAEAIAAYLDWYRAHPDGQAGSTVQSFGPVHARHGPVRPVYVVDDDKLLSKDIALQLEYLGYDVIIINDLDQLALALSERPPAAVIMDMIFNDSEVAGATALTRIRGQSGLKFPAIFISTSNQFEMRLAAVRAGADGYFSKPLDVLSLSDRLDVLTERTEIAPYRILIVDDDPVASAFYRAVLEDAGMEVLLLHQPSAILGVLSDFQPELILMDVYMPECSGIELARLIRQDNKCLDMPIVFLSSEDDLGKQLDAIESGADDFLTKPIAPEHLVSAISSRGARYRALRSLIMRDSLTMLFNHSAIKEHLGREIARARRSGGELALAMIDLDCFKSVNDTYGHPVGDHVIRALSRLLQQISRQCDIVGRYGGEEFTVIFPATSAPTAKMVLDKIRALFSKVRHFGNGREFSVTFSAGVVALDAEEDGDALFCRADAALYLAKQAGRNQVALG